MGVLAIACGVALSVMVLVIGVYRFINRQQRAGATLIRDRLTGFGSTEGVHGATSILKEFEDTIGILDRLIAGHPFQAVVEDTARRAGLDWTAGTFLKYICGAVLAGAIAALFIPFILALPLGIAIALVPFFVLTRRRVQRQRKIEEQLPDAVEMLVNSIRAGLSLQAGMNFIGTEMAAPVGVEFARFYDEQRLGVDMRQALTHLQERLGTVDARMLVLAIQVQRETGGNLAEILGTIARVMRERIHFRDHVSTLTAESKVSAYILSALPALLFVLIEASNPEYIAELTNSSTGQSLLVYAAASLAVGMVLMQKISKVEA